jgi:hypothetical protein
MINGLDLLGVALNQLHGHCSQVSEQSSGTRIRSGGEVYFDSRRCGGIVIARASIPDANFPNPLMAIGFPVASCNSSSNLPVARLRTTAVTTGSNTDRRCLFPARKKRSKEESRASYATLSRHRRSSARGNRFLTTHVS